MQKNRRTNIRWELAHIRIFVRLFFYRAKPVTERPKDAKCTADQKDAGGTADQKSARIKRKQNSLKTG